MTKEEAIARLKANREMFVFEETKQALDMAIEALQREEAEEKGYCHRIKPKEYFSTDAEDRLYIKIYADDEPSVKAEKLYQICGETQNREVSEWLKEYFPSADAIHSGGVFVPNMEMPKVCDYCLFHDSEWSWCKAKDKYCGDGKCPLIAVRGERREP